MPNPAEPPEVTSGEFWGGPGAGTFFASAAQLEALAGLIIGMLGGHSAVEAALSASWPAPTGASAVAANVPHMLWLGTVATMLQTAGAQIAATGEQFEVAKMATPTPAEVAYNQSEHVALNAANFLGFLTPYIMANRAQYGSYWVRGVSNKSAYEAASAAGV
ncbi:MAG TPA: PPE family protein, partial [Mycobacterium sp.]|nr:PPE family protein [Mycobacterium sp.]